jgi:hypothetical protein
LLGDTVVVLAGAKGRGVRTQDKRVRSPSPLGHHLRCAIAEKRHQRTGMVRSKRMLLREKNFYKNLSPIRIFLFAIVTRALEKHTHAHPTLAHATHANEKFIKIKYIYYNTILYYITITIIVYRITRREPQQFIHTQINARARVNTTLRRSAGTRRLIVLRAERGLVAVWCTPPPPPPFSLQPDKILYAFRSLLLPLLLLLLLPPPGSSCFFSQSTAAAARTCVVFYTRTHAQSVCPSVYSPGTLLTPT